MTGTASRKEKRAAAPRGEAEGEARGDRDPGPRRPGHEGEGLGASDEHRAPEAEALRAAGSGAPAVGREQGQGEDEVRARDDGRCSKVQLDRLAGEEARRSDRYGGRDHHPSPAALGGEGARAEDRAQPAARELPEVAAEIRDHRGERANMHGHVEGETLVGPAEQGGNEDEVRRARDRKELGEPLDEGEDDRLDGVHDGGGRPGNLTGSRAGTAPAARTERARTRC